MFRSATFKLTMWYLAIVMFISLAFSGALYHVTTGQLEAGLNHQYQRIYTQFPVFQGNPLLRVGPDYDHAAHNILLRLISFNIIVFVGAGFSSYWLARRTLAPIEEAHEQQKRFTSDVSHELRTPLTALRMESEVALMSPDTSKAELRDTLNSNLEEVSKLEKLINNLLRLTRLEANELQQSFTAFSNKTVVDAAVKQVQTLAKTQNIKLKSTVQEVKGQGDAESLTQLLVILLDNAIKYSSAKSEVEITSEQLGDQVTFTIKDQGKGIEPEALEHVFDRFYRAEDSRVKQDQEDGGYGLGLSIAKMIADIHQGDIVLKSRSGQGTTAVVSIPLTKVSQGEA